MMLRDDTIYFEGSAAELQASKDPYIRRFLAGSAAQPDR